MIILDLAKTKLTQLASLLKDRYFVSQHLLEKGGGGGGVNTPHLNLRSLHHL